ncbi:MAG TPA: SMP-30/gluconolactonase/LRE family protein [Pseudonocardia sp.]
MAADQVTESVTYHGEGAVWSTLWGGLKCVDMLAGDVLSVDVSTGSVSRLHVGSPVAAAVRPRTRGGFVVATEREFALWGDAGREWSSPALWTGGIRFNEGSCDPLGRFLCGSMSYEGEAGAGAMWRLNLDGSTERLFEDVTISNGLGFTGAGDRAYYVDTRTRRIDLFDVEDGELVRRRPFVTVPEGVGNPDGLCVDAADGVWVALYGGSAVRHYSRDGVLEDVVAVGAAQVTSCTLGGPELSTLYITTSRENLSADEQPAAGAIFRAEVGVVGVPVLASAL